VKRARNQEVIRQWKLVFALEGARLGRSIDELAAELKVSTRTIRRDLAALEEAGFPLEDHRRGEKTCWRLNRDGFRDGLVQAGFTLSELAALYFSRTLLQYLAGAPFEDDLRSAFDKLEEVLSPGMRDYIDQLPAVLTAKAEPRKQRDEPRLRDLVKRLTRAALDHRVVTMRYHSFQSRAEKDYRVEPYQLAYGQGGLYLLAFVPAYDEMRTFAVQRIRQLTVEDERFTPVGGRVGEAFVNSMGINNAGRPEPVAIEFSAAAAPYAQERQWHRSQTVEALPDGTALIRLQVVVDWALMAWILSFGPFARVVEPPGLAARILERLEEARLVYMPRLALEDGPDQAVDRQRALPDFRAPRAR
jgi:predicted DNA-binding transcriptional regulator YafY